MKGAWSAMEKKKRGRPPGANRACKGCMYQGHLYTSDKELRTCDYLLITGHRRPCPPGAGCTAKKLVNGRSRRKTDK